MSHGTWVQQALQMATIVATTMSPWMKKIYLDVQMVSCEPKNALGICIL